MKTYQLEPKPYDYGSYDAVWIAAYANVLAGTSLDDPAAILQQFKKVVTVYLGYSGLTNLNAAGDKNYGPLGFTKIVQTNSGYDWDYFAGYQFSAQRDNYLVIDESRSRIDQWELY